MNRIVEKMDILKQKNQKALITYMTAGLPSLEKTAEIIRTQAKAQVDVIELGIPFSDPIADGPVIQAASYKSIKQGTTLTKTFEIVKKVREDCQVPIIFMLYYNTILNYGIEKFVDTCIEAQVDGIIVPDMPFEEQFEINEFLNRENAPIIIQLVSPVSKNRVPRILKEAKGFVYCVSSMGVTGQKAEFHKDVAQYLKSVKEISRVPVMMGFGIRTAKDVENVKEIIDGCIVGSAFINLMEENNYDLQVISDYISNFKEQLNMK